MMPAGIMGWIRGFNAQAIVDRAGRFFGGGFVSQNANEARGTGRAAWPLKCVPA
jgi:hypothetical protein